MCIVVSAVVEDGECEDGWICFGEGCPFHMYRMQIVEGEEPSVRPELHKFSIRRQFIVFSKNNIMISVLHGLA